MQQLIRKMKQRADAIQSGDKAAIEKFLLMAAVDAMYATDTRGVSFQQAQDRAIDGIQALAAAMESLSGDPRWRKMIVDPARLVDFVWRSADTEERSLLATEAGTPDPKLRALFAAKLAN